MEDVQHVAELGGTQMRVIGSNIAPFGQVYNDTFDYLLKYRKQNKDETWSVGTPRTQL